METENRYIETDLGNVAPNPRGNYNTEAAYEYLDLVVYQGGSYLCVADTSQGTAPEPGKTTAVWQVLTLPGDLTPEYVAMHDNVVNKAASAAEDAASTATDRAAVADMKEDVEQLQREVAESTASAKADKESAAGYAAAAEASRKAAAEAEANVTAQVTGFDEHVASKTLDATEAVTAAREKAVQVVDSATQAAKSAASSAADSASTATQAASTATSQATAALAASKTATSAASETVKTAKAAQEDIATAKSNAIKAVQDAAVEEKKAAAASAENAATSAESAKTSADNAAQSAKSVEDASKQIEQNKKDVASLKEDLSNKITKFYASNQGEIHITDSDNGKIQDMMIYGKSSQDGTPTPDNPVEIKSVVNPTIKLLGSNILKIMDDEYQSGGVTVTVSNGVVKLKGTANTYQDIALIQNRKMFFKEGTEIIFSPNKIKDIEGQNNGYLDFSNNNTMGFSIKNNNINAPYIIKKEDAKYSFELYIRCPAGITYDEIWKPQVLIGETITTFKPYTEQTITLPITLNAIPVSSGGNVTIDGQQYIADYVDVERGKVVRKINKLILTGEENWTHGYDTWATYPHVFKNENLKEHVLTGNIMNTKYLWYQKNANIDLNSINAPYDSCIAVSDSRFSTVDEFTSELKKQNSNGTPLIVYYIMSTPQEEDLSLEEIELLKSLSTYYPVTNISVNSEQLDGYTVFNYTISMANGWNYVKQQIGDTRDYIYDMDLQSAEAYVNSEYAVALTELEV